MHYFKPHPFISFFAFLVIGSICHGQQTEFKVNAYSGLFFFRGSGATATSTVHAGDDLGYFNPTSYGKKSGFSYAIEWQTQRVTKQKHVWGLGVSYENLKSKAVVDSFYGDRGIRSATGNVIMTNIFMTVNPYVGQRFVWNNITLDALIGIDLSFNAKVREKAKVTSLHQFYTANKPAHPTDLRPRVQVHAFYKRIGLSAGYSAGTENLYYYDNPNYRNKKAYANFVRLGFGYRLH